MWGICKSVSSKIDGTGHESRWFLLFILLGLLVFAWGHSHCDILKTHATWIIMFLIRGALKAQGTVSSRRWVFSVHTPTRVTQESKIITLLMQGPRGMCIHFGVPRGTLRQNAWHWSNTSAYGHTYGAWKSDTWGLMVWVWRMGKCLSLGQLIRE